MSLHENLRARRGEMYAARRLKMEPEPARAFGQATADQQIQIENSMIRLGASLGAARRFTQCIFTRKERRHREAFGTAGDPVCGCADCAPIE